MVKGAISLVVIAGVVWFFWMTKEWLRNPNRNNKNGGTENNSEQKQN